jgi:DivIVA domain-containing protein
VPFSPEEIESKEFLVVLRGYDKDEVGSFLRSVADDVRALNDQIAQGGNGATTEAAPAPTVAPAPVEQAAPAQSGDVFTDLGSEMAAVLRSANEAAQTLRQKAEDEANARIQAATDEATGLRRAATDEADAILAAARQVRSEAAEEATNAREAANREAADARSAAVREAEQIVEAALARRDRLSREVLELQRRLESAQDTLRALLDIVAQSQLGDEPGSNGSNGNNESSSEQGGSGSAEGHGDENRDDEMAGQHADEGGWNQS